MAQLAISHDPKNRATVAMPQGKQLLKLNSRSPGLGCLRGIASLACGVAPKGQRLLSGIQDLIVINRSESSGASIVQVGVVDVSQVRIKYWESKPNFTNCLLMPLKI